FLCAFWRVGMGVQTHPVSHLAAKQLIDGHTERLALDIPQRHFDAGHGAAADNAGHAMAHHAQIHFLPEFFDLKWVLTDENARQVMDCGFYNARPTAGFAHAINARVSEDFDKTPVARLPAGTIRHTGMHEIGLDLSDFHGFSR